MKTIQDFSQEFHEENNSSTMTTMDSSTPSIPEWFRKRHVLITGATGFMGKVLVYKLLTSCPDIDKIYLLVREKRGVAPRARLQSIVQAEPFKGLCENNPEKLDKLVVISGDVTIEGLGLSAADKDLLEREVSVVFHGAANVKFDTPIRDAITMNTRGVMNLLALAKQMHRLESLVHISTSYSQCGEEVLEERSYPSPISPENVMILVNMLHEDHLESLTPKLLKEQPNTYAFSKALGEDLVNRSNLPVGIARPSIVVASWKEPASGWIDSINGPTGLMIGAAKGVIRTVLCDPDLLIDAMPCDIAVNAIIALAWHVGVERPGKPIFMNVTESGENPMTWGETLEYGRTHALANPYSGILWYPRGGITRHKYVHLVCVFFMHLMPAYFIDALCFVTGNKPFMIRVQKKVSWGMKLIEYYTLKPWVFRNDGMKELRQRLSPADKETFFMDTKAYKWDDYMKNYILGARKFILKEDPATLPRARKIFFCYWVADILLWSSLALFLIWAMYSYINPFGATRTLVEVIEH